MAFPVVVTTNESATPTASTSHVVNLPPSLVAGNLIVILCDKGTPATTATFNALAGWTELLDENLASGLAMWCRVSDGAEGATVTFTSTAAIRDACTSYQISGAADPATQLPELSTVATGTSANPNATTCTPTGGAKDYLWITMFGQAGEQLDDDSLTTVTPTNYGTPIEKTCGTAGTNLGGMIASAHRTANAASEDATAWTSSDATAWRAYTIAVHPGVPQVNVAGDLVATATLTGTAAADHTVSGNLAVTAALTGTAVPDIAVAGNLAATATLTGTIDVTAGGAPQVDVDGSLAATAILTGTATADHAVAGNLAVTATRTGTASVDVAVAGDCPVTVTLTGTATADRTIAGNRPVTATITGDIDVIQPGQVNIDGNRTITATITGTARTDPGVAGSLAVTATRTGTIDLALAIAGNLAAQALITGSIDVAGAYTPQYSHMDADLHSIASHDGGTSTSSAAVS